MGLHTNIAKLKFYERCKRKIYSEDGEFLKEEDEEEYCYTEVLAGNEDLNWDGCRYVGDERIFYDFLTSGICPIEVSPCGGWFRPVIKHIKYVRERTEEILNDLGCQQMKNRWGRFYDMVENDGVWMHGYGVDLRR